MTRRIAFDLRPLQDGFKAHKLRGIGVYTRALISNAPTKNSDISVASFHDPGYESLESKKFGSTPLVIGTINSLVGPILKEGLRQNLFRGGEISAFAKAAKADLIFFPTHLDVPSGLNVPYVVCAHDMIQSALAEKFYQSFRSRISIRRQISALQSATKIIAVSEHTKQDVIRYADIDPDKITVIYNGVEESFCPGDSSASDRFALPDKFILNVGGIDWRKNVELLFSAYADLVAFDPTYHLVLTGDIESDPRYTDFCYRLADSGLADKVHSLGFVSRDELIALYRRAKIFFYPSLYEGFGLPVLESMACGTPVITTNRSSLPEVGGVAAILLDPDDPQDFSTALLDLAQDIDKQNTMIKLGLEQATKFSWQNSAAQLFDMLAQV